jgi:hypothetical protein
MVVPGMNVVEVWTDAAPLVPEIVTAPKETEEGSAMSTRFHFLKGMAV